jgi:hypothetical protein
LLGQGEAERRKLVMNADGALDKKLSTWLKANADAIKGYQGQWVPSVVMGGGTNGHALPGSGAQVLVDMLTAKTAKELGLDLGVLLHTCGSNKYRLPRRI